MNKKMYMGNKEMHMGRSQRYLLNPRPVREEPAGLMIHRLMSATLLCAITLQCGWCPNEFCGLRLYFFREKAYNRATCSRIFVDDKSIVGGDV